MTTSLPSLFLHVLHLRSCFYDDHNKSTAIIKHHYIMISLPSPPLPSRWSKLKSRFVCSFGVITLFFFSLFSPSSLLFRPSFASLPSYKYITDIGLYAQSKSSRVTTNRISLFHGHSSRVPSPGLRHILFLPPYPPFSLPILLFHRFPILF